MAGHSKWANIQHRKRAVDAKRGKIFTKLIKEITVAARLGGSDIATNPRLRLAVDKALSHNMPKDNIERAIKRGSGDLEGIVYEEIRYEGYGPGGVAIMVDCMTDNKNRSVAEVRHALSKHGGNLGTDGSVAYLFAKVGVLSYGPDTDENAIMEAALEGGAEDILIQDDNSIEVITSADTFIDVKQTLIDAGLTPDTGEVTMRPSTEVSLDIETAQKLLLLQEHIEELDDVQAVYTNAAIPDAAYEDTVT